MKWFKHDSTARLDAKIQHLVARHGAEGYAIYWYCLEAIAFNVDSHNLTFELEDDAILIARYFSLSPEVVEAIMRYMVELGLFENSEGKISCLRMATRTDEYTAKLIKNVNSLPTVSRQSHDSVPTKSENVRINRIDKNRIEKKNTGGRFAPPSLSEVSDYCKERRNSVDPQSFIDHYDANGWMRGKNKIKDWKACVRTWEKSSRPNAGHDSSEAYY